jgi:hypothetical protein
MVSDRVHKSGHDRMISLYGMRGKSIGFADRFVVPAVPRPPGPWERLALHETAARIKQSAALPQRPASAIAVGRRDDVQHQQEGVCDPIAGDGVA